MAKKNQCAYRNKQRDYQMKLRNIKFVTENMKTLKKEKDPQSHRLKEMERLIMLIINAPPILYHKDEGVSQPIQRQNAFYIPSKVHTTQ